MTKFQFSRWHQLGRVTTVVLILLGSNQSLGGETVIPGGTILGNTVWTSNGSPYTITAPLRVAPGATLDILPGVEVRFRAHGQVVVQGELLSVGTEDAPVRFGSPLTGQVWGAVRAVNTDSVPDFYPVAVRAGNGTIIAGWRSQQSTNEPSRVVYARSLDAGRTWSSPTPLIPTWDTGGFDITNDGKQNWMVVWAGSPLGNDRDIMFITSSDDAQTWSSVGVVDNTATVDQFMLRYNDNTPRAATDGEGTWMVFWEGYKPIFQQEHLSGGGTDVVFALTTDFGHTWTDPKHVNNFGGLDGPTDIDQAAALLSLGDERWLAFWYSTNGFGGKYAGPWNTFVSRSLDDGATWSDPTPVNNDASETLTERPSFVGTAHSGSKLLALFEGRYSPNRGFGSDSDVFIAASEDEGTTWSPITALNSNAAQDATSEISPRIAVNDAGEWMVVWASNDPLPLSDTGCGVGSDFDVFFATSTDGSHWSAGDVLNSNASVDSGTDSPGSVLPVGPHEWLVVWASNSLLDGGVGTDFDVVYAFTNFPDADGDGIPDEHDTCPNSQDPDQFDSDGDGVGDVCDRCPDTPPGSAVQSDGSPRSDLDGDCDVDLRDYSIFQNDFFGPE